MFFCRECNIYVNHSRSSHNRTNAHKTKSLIQSKYDNVQIIRTAFKNRIVSYKINPKTTTLVPEKFLSQIFKTVGEIINVSLKIHDAIKVNFELFVTYILPKNFEKSIKSFSTKYSTIVQSTDIDNFLIQSAQKLIS